jgi:hypothetical protein
VYLHREGDLFPCPGETPSALITAATKDDTEGVCGTYYGVIVDAGTFTTLPGAKSPNAGVPVTPTKGHVWGTAMTTEFTAHYKGDWANGQTFVGAGGTATNPSTTNWVKTYFDHVSLDYALPKWTWTYTTDCEKWVDASDNGYGALPDDGDIIGKTCPSPSPSPSLSPSPSPTPTPSSTPTPTPAQPGMPNTGRPAGL